MEVSALITKEFNASCPHSSLAGVNSVEGRGGWMEFGKGWRGKNAWKDAGERFRVVLHKGGIYVNERMSKRRSWESWSEFQALEEKTVSAEEILQQEPCGNGEASLRSCQLLQAAQPLAEKLPCCKVLQWPHANWPATLVSSFHVHWKWQKKRHRLSETVSDSARRLGSCLLAPCHCPSQPKSFLPTRRQLFEAIHRPCFSSLYLHYSVWYRVY